MISICFSKIAGAPIGSLKFLVRRYGVTDSGCYHRKPAANGLLSLNARMCPREQTENIQIRYVDSVNN
ncbi:MAG: hypothetical protein P8X89_07660 [Reinekea sp.]